MVLFLTVVLVLLYVSGVKAQVGSLSERDMKKFEEAKTLYFERNFKGSEKILDKILERSQSLICQKDTFLGAEESVEVKISFQKR